MNVECKIFKMNDEGKFEELTKGFEEKFTLKDFQFGDIITLRNGERYVYADGTMYGEKEQYALDCEILTEIYNEDLIATNVCENVYDFNKKSCDIMNIERQREVVYERKEETVEMTLSEVCKKLGYNVKIVKEKSEE